MREVSCDESPGIVCHVDDFWQAFAPAFHQRLLETGQRQRRRSSSLSMSEIMTVLIHFHQSHYRTFKASYPQYVLLALQGEFPGLVSYTRLVELMPSARLSLCAYLETCQGPCRGISFVDSTPLAVCHNRRIKQHRVFEGLAQRGKDSVGWFYGCKRHVIVNDQRELLACRLTSGNVDDRKPLPQLAQRLFGKLIGDKGYLSKQVFDTNLRSNQQT
jgi:hypothetical protein